jgi:hypothetical protein
VFKTSISIALSHTHIASNEHVLYQLILLPASISGVKTCLMNWKKQHTQVTAELLNGYLYSLVLALSALRL